jgi:hypothetical protein
LACANCHGLDHDRASIGVWTRLDVTVGLWKFLGRSFRRGPALSRRTPKDGPPATVTARRSRKWHFLSFRITMGSAKVEPNPPIATHVDILIARFKDGIACLRVLMLGFVARRRKSDKPPSLGKFLLCCLFFLCVPSRATELIMIVSGSGGSAVLAADSLIIGDEGTLPRKGCKIKQTGKFFWVASGLTEDHARGYRVASFVHPPTTVQNATAAQMLDDVGKRILPSLQVEIPYIKREAPAFYAIIRKHGTILVLMAVHDSGVGIEAYAKEFWVDNDRVSTLPASTCADLATGCIVASRLTGDNSEIHRYIENHPETPQLDPIVATDNIMALAIKIDPADVAPPVSILRIAPNSTRWLRQNDCADIQTDRKPAPKRVHKNL